MAKTGDGSDKGELDGTRFTNLVWTTSVLVLLVFTSYMLVVQADAEYTRQEHMWEVNVRVIEARNAKISSDNQQLRDQGITDREYTLEAVPSRGSFVIGYVLWLIPIVLILAGLSFACRWFGGMWWEAMFPPLYTIQRPHKVKSRQGNVKAILTPDEAALEKPPWFSGWLRTWRCNDRDTMSVAFFSGLASCRMDVMGGPIEVEKNPGYAATWKVRVNRVINNTDSGRLEAVHEDENATLDRAVMWEVEVDDDHWDDHMESLQSEARRRVTMAMDMNSEVARSRAMFGVEPVSFSAAPDERPWRPIPGNEDV